MNWSEGFGYVVNEYSDNCMPKTFGKLTNCHHLYVCVLFLLSYLGWGLEWFNCWWMISTESCKDRNLV